MTAPEPTNPLMAVLEKTRQQRNAAADAAAMHAANCDAVYAALNDANQQLADTTAKYDERIASLTAEMASMSAQIATLQGLVTPPDSDPVAAPETVTH